MDKKYDELEMQYYIQKVREINAEFEMKHGRQPFVYTRTFGCQQNVSDGEKLKGMLAEMGYTFTEQVENADFILYNTCAVRENAEDRVFGNVGALKHQKARNPDLIVGLCGCMTQQAHIAERIRRSFPHVDLVFGTHALHHLPELLYQKLSGQNRVFDIEHSDGEIVEDIPLHRDGTVRAWLPIMYGCNNFCTYCVVPLVRGRERSRQPERILAEARQLVAEGYKEIVLLGQNVNSYGKTLAQPMRFAELLRGLNAIDGDFRIRFMTSHPRDCTRELLDAMADCDKVAKHLHLPVQSGSDRILSAMNRHYTSGEYLELIAYAKERMPGITFTSDILVGFPGETEEDFQKTLDLVKQVEYLSLFTFVYSPRKGTKAASMADPAPREEKMRWFQHLLDTQAEIGMSHHKAMVGTVRRVLADGHAREPGMITGRTESNSIVNFPGSEHLIGHFIDIKITDAMQWALVGDSV